MWGSAGARRSVGHVQLSFRAAAAVFALCGANFLCACRSSALELSFAQLRPSQACNALLSSRCLRRSFSNSNDRGVKILSTDVAADAAQASKEGPGPARMQSLWREAAISAASALQADGANATTVLMPSGSSLVMIGLYTVLELLAQGGEPRRVLVLTPGTHHQYTLRLYSNMATAGMEVRSTQVHGQPMGATKLRELLSEPLSAPMVIISSLEEVGSIALAQTDPSVGAIDLMVMEMAHLVRAGGHELASQHVKAAQHLYISARRLVGLAPGALLAPGQEPDYPKRASAATYGSEAFRLSHADAYQLKLAVPVQIAVLKGTKVTEVAEQLAHMHTSLGIRAFKLVPHRHSFAAKLHQALQDLTDGGCGISAGGTVDRGQPLQAVVLADPEPDYVMISEELSRLARPAPGKRCGYIVTAASSMQQAVAAWRALAIEDVAVEEALQDAGVESGRLDRDLRLQELPTELVESLQVMQGREHAELCATRGIKTLSDPWDRWYGRILAYKDTYGDASRIPRMKDIFGHQLGFWLANQRLLCKRRQLDSEKVLKLRRAGVMMEIFEETFTRGLRELRRYVLTKRTREIPTNYRTESGFDLGAWVLRMRTLQRRGKLKSELQESLQEAFFLWQPSGRQGFAKHPGDFDAAMVTRAIEEELTEMRWRPRSERKQFFRSMVLKYHPDVSEEKHATEAIQFLSDIRDWFLT
mmetsp:Transcript_41008/g.92006  ORF Transcript_41008/g.92006 Transcript_41008/m.92006 type:complete len:702 (+) Transcript_41008:69-2174(+)